MIRRKLLHNHRICLVLLLMAFCASCAGKASVTLWKNDIDFSNYKKVYYTVCNPDGEALNERISVADDMGSYLFRPLGFEIPQEEGKFIEKSDDYVSYIVSLKDRKGALFVRSNFEYGLSIPPRLRREFDGLIWNHRKLTTIRVMDLQTEEDLATLKYERRYFDGVIPEEALYKLLMTAISEGKDYLESE